MVRALQKHKKTGEQYLRRPEVEAEITALKSLNIEEIEKRSLISSQTNHDYMSVEALLYFVRNTRTEDFNPILLEELLRRFHRLLPWTENAGGESDSLTNTFIRESVNDTFIENLVYDKQTYNEKLDYYEVNYNHAVSNDIKDAERKFWKNENRQTTYETTAEEENFLEAVRDGDSSYDPFDTNEIDKIIYRRKLEEAINQLPINQQRVIEMELQGIPIDSKFENVVTMSKVLSVSEKTARTYRNKAFEALRKKLEF